MNIIQELAWALYMGAAFTICGWNFRSWQFYVAIIPICLLEAWSKKL